MSHETLAQEAEDAYNDPAKLGVKLSAELLEPCYTPIIQSVRRLPSPSDNRYRWSTQPSMPPSPPCHPALHATQPYMPPSPPSPVPAPELSHSDPQVLAQSETEEEEGEEGGEESSESAQA